MNKTLTRLSICIFLIIFVVGLFSCSNLNDSSEFDNLSEGEVIQCSNYIKYIDMEYGEDEEQTLDLYIPTNYNLNGIIVAIHGGAWTSGDKSEYDNLMASLAESRAACATINYRYASNDVSFYDIINDITTALNRIKSFSQNRLGISFTKMMTLGHSAGGHLSMMYTYKYGDVAPITPVCVLSLAGPTDLTLDSYYENSVYGEEIYTIMSCLLGVNITENNRAKLNEDILNISPINYINNFTVPTLLVYGSLDNIVFPENANNLKEKLTENNVTHNLVWFENSGHELDKDEDKLSLVWDLLIQYAVNYLV